MKERKHACDDEMLQELDVLEPKGIREKLETRTNDNRYKEKAWLGDQLEQ